MGQAFDRDGNVLGEAFGNTKSEVFEKLNEQFKQAHEIRIRSLDDRASAGGALAELPRYKCHKEVWAAKILDIRDYSDPGRNSDGSRWLVIEGNYAPIHVDAAYMQKHQPKTGGYYVVYKDGYKSFSPADAFEEGYTRL
jgi:hypothetical protein